MFNPITYGILTFRQLRGGGGGALSSAEAFNCLTAAVKKRENASAE